jgi:hypothetical protein
MLYDQLELLHIEEVPVIPVKHGLVPLYAVLLVVAVGKRLVAFVHEVAEPVAT